LILSSKDIGIVGNADKTKYMFMSQDQNRGQSQNMNIDNRCFEMVEEFRCLGIAFTNQNSLQEELKSRLKSGNACYDLVLNLLSSCSLSKNLKIYGPIVHLLLFGVTYCCDRVGPITNIIRWFNKD
jgi:hypothetical protein